MHKADFTVRFRQMAALDFFPCGKYLLMLLRDSSLLACEQNVFVGLGLHSPASGLSRRVLKYITIPCCVNPGTWGEKGKSLHFCERSSA